MSVQLAGSAGLRNSNRPMVSVTTIDFTAFRLFLPEMNFSRPLRPVAGQHTRTSEPSMIPVCPLAPRWSMTSASVRSRMPGATVQPRSASRGRTSDRTRNGGAIATEPAGQHVVRGAMTEVRQRGQQSVDEDELVLGPGTDGPAAGS